MDPREPPQDPGSEHVAVDLLGEERKDTNEDRERVAGARLGQCQDDRQGAPDQRAEERHGLEEKGDDPHQQGHLQPDHKEADGRHHADEQAGQELATNVFLQGPTQPLH